MFDINKLFWIREPKNYKITKDIIEITTEPHTDLWQKTYFNAIFTNFEITECKWKAHDGQKPNM